MARDLCEELYRLYRGKSDAADKAKKVEEKKKEEGSGESNNGGTGDALNVDSGVPPSVPSFTNPPVSVTQSQMKVQQSPQNQIGSQSVSGE